MLLLVLNLAGTFAFGLSGGMAGVRARLDLFGVVVLAVVVGIAGGIIRDLLIGVPPATFRDWRYLAVAGGAGLVAFLAYPLLSRIGGPIDVLDAAGLALFCVTGASAALDYGLPAAPAVILGAITGIGGGVLRDILVRQIPVVLREGLYAIPALIGAAIVVGAARAGAHGPVAPIIGATACFVIRLAGLTLGLNIPRARGINRD
jgi:uncharacterized membrane protein YeiH